MRYTNSPWIVDIIVVPPVWPTRRVRVGQEWATRRTEQVDWTDGTAIFVVRKEVVMWRVYPI